MSRPRLNDEQRAAVSARDRHLLLAAGAGSGKTRVLVERYLGILEDGGWDSDLPARLLAITFTEKAAQEMRERILDALVERAAGLDAGDPVAARLAALRREMEAAPISTIHGFCSRVLRENAVEAGLDPQFRVPSELEQMRLEASCVDALFAEAPPELGRLVTALGAAAVADALRDLGALRRSLGLENADLAEASLPALAAEHAELGRAGLIGALGRWLAELPGRVDGLASHLPGGVHWNEKGREKIAAARALAAALDAGAPDAAAILAVAEALKGLPQTADGAKDERLAKKLDVLRKAIKPAAADAALLAAGSAGADGRPPGLDADFLRLLRRHQERLRAEKEQRAWLDFEDLQLRAVTLLEGSEAVRERYHRQLRHVMVDEFQDTNLLQLRLVRALVPPGTPAERRCLFLVGDARQSIYAFRNADVALFRGLHAEMGARGETGDLRLNYRSHPALLGFAGDLFPRGEFPPLEPGLAEAYATGRPSEAPRVRVLAAPGGDGAALGAQRAARALAAALREARDAELPVLDPATGEARAIDWGDMAVLLRAGTGAPAVCRALEEAGVPYAASAGRETFLREELRDLESLLAALDDPYHPFTLARGLRSDPVGLSTSDLVRVLPPRPAAGAALAARLAAAARGELGLSEAGREAVAFFLELREALAGRMARLPLDRLLQELVAASRFDLACAAGREPLRRLRNLQSLVELAGELEENQRLTVGEFLEFMDHLRERPPRREEAWVPEEGESLVRVQTLHSAKGLEFPLVALADLQRPYNFRSLAAPVLALRARAGDGAPRAPVGLRWRAVDGNGDEPDATWRWIQREGRERELAEQDRLLYVGVTRARDWLILAGHLRDAADEDAAREVWNAPAAEEPGCALDRLRLAWPRLAGRARLEFVPAGFAGEDAAAPAAEGAAEAEPGASPAAAARGTGGVPAAAGDDDPAAARRRWEALCAPRVDDGGPVEMSVTSLALLVSCPLRWLLERRLGLGGLLSEQGEPWLAGEPRDDAPAMGAAAFGSLLHRILERWDFHARPADAFDAACPAGLDDSLRREARAMLEPIFSEPHPWPRRLRAGTSFQREAPFLLDLGEVVLTGQMDLVFESEGRRYLLDWKSDRVEGKEELLRRRDHHQFQIALYALALRAANRPAAQAALCFLRPGAFRQVDIEQTLLEWVANKARRLGAQARRLSWLAADVDPALAGKLPGAIPRPQGPPCRGCPYREGPCPRSYRSGSLHD